MAASSSGGNSANLRLQKPDSHLIQTMQYWGGLAREDANESEEKRIAKTKADSDAIKTANADIAFNPSDFTTISTGWQNVDMLKRDIADKHARMYTDIYKKAQESLSKGDMISRRKYDTQLNLLKQGFKQFNNMDQQLKSRFEEYHKMASEGKMSGKDKDDWEKKFQALLVDRTFDVNIDPETMALSVDGYVYNDETGEKESVFKFDERSLLKGDFRPYQHVQLITEGTGKDDDKGIITTFAKGLGSHTYDDKKGSIIRTINDFDKPRQAATESYIASIIGNDEMVFDLAYQFGIDTKDQRKNFSKEIRNQIGDELEKMIIGAYNTQNKVTVNTKEAELAAKKQKDAQDYELGKERNKILASQKPKPSNGKNYTDEEIVQYSDLAFRIAQAIASGDKNDDAVENIANKYGIAVDPAWRISTMTNKDKNSFEIHDGTGYKMVEQGDIVNIAKHITGQWGIEMDKDIILKYSNAILNGDQEAINTIYKAQKVENMATPNNYDYDQEAEDIINNI